MAESMDVDHDDSTTTSSSTGAGIDNIILQNNPALSRSIARGRRDKEARAANPPDDPDWSHVMEQSRRMDHQQLPTDNYRSRMTREDRLAARESALSIAARAAVLEQDQERERTKQSLLASAEAQRNLENAAAASNDEPPTAAALDDDPLTVAASDDEPPTAAASDDEPLTAAASDDELPTAASDEDRETTTQITCSRKRRGGGRGR